MFNAFAILLCPLLAVAQIYGPVAPAPASVTSGSVAAAVPSAPPSTSTQINIDVAFQEKFVFNPPNVTAAVGTLVTFFFPANGLSHSVTQSAFATPCTYLATNPNPGNTSGTVGFDSGLQQGNQFTINITDTTPIWFHCKQIGHCGMGMVGAINAPASGNTFDAFMTSAKNIGSKEVTETDNGPVEGGIGGSALGTPANTFKPSASGSSGASGASTASASQSSGSSSQSSSSSALTLRSSGLLAFFAAGFVVCLL